MLLLFIVFFIFIFFYISTSELSQTASQTFRLNPNQHVIVGLKDPQLGTFMSFAAMQNLPSSVDLWSSQVGVKDQGPWGSCTAFSTRYAIIIRQLSLQMPVVEPSTAFLYAKSRLLVPGGQLSDSGSTLTATMRVLKNTGIVSENDWPYTGSNIFINPNIVPPESSKIASPVKLPIFKDSGYNVTEIKRSLAGGSPVIIAILVYSSFMSRNSLITGTIPLPSRFDKLQGGHAICLVGYNDTTSRFIFYNSWGSYTGDGGKFTIPYAYVGNPKYAGEYFAFN